MSFFRSAGGRMIRTTQQMRKALAAKIEHKIFIPSVEFFLIDTCNLRCVSCAPSSPFMSDANLPSLDSFAESLSFLSKVVKCDELRFLGGEPLLNQDIGSFLRVAKQSKIFRSILVATNGLLLPKMRREFWQLADTVRISIYPATAHLFSNAKLESLQATASEFGTNLVVARNTHFLEAISDVRIEDPSVVRRNFLSCGEAHEWSCHLLYRNHLYRCSRVHTLDRYLSRIGLKHENFTDKDGILIDGRRTLLADLRNYLKSSEPLKACSFCFGTSGPLVPHRQWTVEQIRSKSGRLERSLD